MFCTIFASILLFFGSHTCDAPTVGANSTISNLTAKTTVSGDDLMAIVDNSAVPPTTKKLTFANATSTFKVFNDLTYSPIAGNTSLVTVGTIGTGVWNGTVIGASKGGTGSTTLASNQLFVGNGTGAVVSVSNGSAGQYLTSNGAGSAPSFQSSSIDQAANYAWTGTHSFAATTSFTSTVSVSATATMATTSFSGTVSGVSSLMSTFVAADTITAGQAIVIGDGSSVNSATVSSGHATPRSCDSPNWMSQKFTTSAKDKSVKSVTVWVGDSAANTTLTASVRANSAGQPTGADIGGLTGTVSINTAGSLARTITFSTPIPVSASTDYHMIFRGAGTCNIYGNDVGSQGTNSSANSGSSWSASNGALELSMTKIDTTSGQVSPSSASTTFSTALYNNFIGFAQSNITSGNSGVIVTNGVVTGLSGLTTGATYYLSDTIGEISSSAGTVSRKIGTALSATTLLIKHDIP